MTPMRRPAVPLRPIAMLAALSLVAGVVVAGMVFPVVAALGRGAVAVGDSVNSVSTELVDGPLPQTSTVTDADGNPIARFFDPNQNRQVLRPGADLAGHEGGDRGGRGPPVLRAPGRGLAGHDARGDRQLGVGRRGAGRVHADPAVREELPALRGGEDRDRAAEGDRADPGAEAEGGADRAAAGAQPEQGGDPRPLPEHRVLRQRRGRGGRGGAHLLQHHRRPADRAAGRAAGRHGALDHGDRPGDQPGGGQGAAQRRASGRCASSR